MKTEGKERWLITIRISQHFHPVLLLSSFHIPLKSKGQVTNTRIILQIREELEQENDLPTVHNFFAVNLRFLLCCFPHSSLFYSNPQQMSEQSNFSSFVFLTRKCLPPPRIKLRHSVSLLLAEGTMLYGTWTKGGLEVSTMKAFYQCCFLSPHTSHCISAHPLSH